jgi:hypothetical protein
MCKLKNDMCYCDEKEYEELFESSTLKNSKC